MAMNFFQNQEQARHSTRVLIVLFVLAVICIVLAVNVALATLYLTAFTRQGTWARYGIDALPHYFIFTTTGVVLLFIIGGTVQQILDLREGGEAVARMVGARPIDPATRDPGERRLLHIVEEMALAAGIPAPRAFVLEREIGINAFAAGVHVNDAVVTVTQGALRRLNRDELQGVIGHEFSHILNGDMSLNLRLIGVLHGLLLLALFGRFLASLNNSRSERSFGALALAGLVVLAVGYIGVFFGRLIKASVSRQREFLADASSVQFTRNPDGIGGALRKIGGLGANLGAGAGGAVEHVQAESLSHMFMAPVTADLADGWLASHPPLDERLLRIYGRPVDYLPADELPAEAPLPPAAGLPPIPYAPVQVSHSHSPMAAAMAVAAAGAAPPDFHSAIGQPSKSGVDFANVLQAKVVELGLRPAVQDATGAQLLALAMLLDGSSGDVRSQQLAAVSERFGAPAAAQLEDYAGKIAGLPPGWRLAIIDLSMPALRTLDAGPRSALLQLAHVLIQADGRVTLAEFLLFTVLRRRLAPPPGTANSRGLALRDAPQESALVMSLIACVRLPKDAERAFVAGKALNPNAGAFVPESAIALANVAAAFDRLAALAPLEKPALVKACVAVAFVDGTSEWRALSCLRTLCAALDCPLPPQAENAPS